MQKFSGQELLITEGAKRNFMVAFNWRNCPEQKLWAAVFGQLTVRRPISEFPAQGTVEGVDCVYHCLIFGKPMKIRVSFPRLPDGRVSLNSDGWSGRAIVVRARALEGRAYRSSAIYREKRRG